MVVPGYHRARPWVQGGHPHNTVENPGRPRPQQTESGSEDLPCSPGVRMLLFNRKVLITCVMHWQQLRSRLLPLVSAGELGQETQILTLDLVQEVKGRVRVSLTRGTSRHTVRSCGREWTLRHWELCATRLSARIPHPHTHLTLSFFLSCRVSPARSGPRPWICLSRYHARFRLFDLSGFHIGNARSFFDVSVKILH